MVTYETTTQTKNRPEGFTRRIHAASLQAALREAVRYADAARMGQMHEVITIRIERTA